MQTIDQNTFSSYFDKFFLPLCQYAFVYCKDKDQCKEIVQEVFMKVWEKREVIDIQGKVSVYLYQMVRNRALNFLRDHKKLKMIGVDDVRVMEVSEELSELPVLELAHIYTAIAELPEKCREIFKLKRIDGLSYKEISVRLSISEKTVENQMTIAFKKLKESLQLIKNELGD